MPRGLRDLFVIRLCRPAATASDLIPTVFNGLINSSLPHNHGFVLAACPPGVAAHGGLDGTLQIDPPGSRPDRQIRHFCSSAANPPAEELNLIGGGFMNARRWAIATLFLFVTLCCGASLTQAQAKHDRFDDHDRQAARGWYKDH